MNKKSLGRGLSSLLSETQIDLNNDQDMNLVEEPNNIKRSKTLSLIPIEKIQPNTKVHKSAIFLQSAK